MRKRVTSPAPREELAIPEPDWLDVERLAQVEVSRRRCFPDTSPAGRRRNRASSGFASCSIDRSG